MTVNVIVAKNKIDCEHLLGQFLDESHFDTLIDSDTDCYTVPDCYMAKETCKDKVCNECTSGANEQTIAFKFRKNFFTKEEQEQAYIGLREAARPTQNRGLASGPRNEKCLNRDWVTEFQLQVLTLCKKIPDSSIDSDIKPEIERLYELYSNKESSRGLVWLSAKIKQDNFNFDKWLKSAIKLPPIERRKQAVEIFGKYVSDTTYANQVMSGIAGWFDRYPRIPYGRATAYTQSHFDKFQMSFPFLQSLDRGFRELLPIRWEAQRSAADRIDSAFLVPGTVFTTITVNKTFRTAAHRDAGDLSEGLSNLLVLSNNGNYTGGYLIFPEYRIAVNVRPGDLLLVNNHEIIHGNTPIILQDEEAERISLVCYFREKMLELGSKEYEDIRYNYVESRRKNKEHKLWKPLWNGVSEGMWEHDEWYDYLEQNGGKKMLDKYHPEAYNTISTLEDLFA